MKLWLEFSILKSILKEKSFLLNWLHHAFVAFMCWNPYIPWNWLHHMLELCLSIGCLEDYFLVIDRSAYAQCNMVSIAVVVSTVYAIWHAYNQAMFQNVSIPWKYACSSIVLMTTMALAGKVFSQLFHARICDHEKYIYLNSPS